MNHDAALAELHSAMERLEPEPQHTAHVAYLASRLFDELQDLHALGPDERVLLIGAGLLHDIGWPVSNEGAAHHKHSARLIREQKWAALGPTEVEMVAMVARYHRKSLPCAEHEDFMRLSRGRQRTIRQLAALLRVADSLDRSHLQHVRNLRTQVDSEQVHLHLLARVTPRREIAGAEKKGDLAREVFGRELAFSYELLAPAEWIAMPTLLPGSESTKNPPPPRSIPLRYLRRNAARN